MALGNSVLTIHMDDLYNGWDDALTITLTNNLAKIVKQFKADQKIELSPYNWKLGHYGQRQTFPIPSLLILEGVGSGQRVTRDFVNDSYWIEIDPDFGIDRVLVRDGLEIAERMKLWKVRQSLHFLAEATESAANYLINGAP